jgi:hypothetical protein
MLRENGGLLEPKSPSGQNARLRGGIEKETEGVTPVSTRHSAPQFPLHPYSERKNLQARGLTRIFMGEFSGERKRVHGMPALGG